MSAQNEILHYHFLNSSVASDRQVLFRNGKARRLSTKPYYLLLAFVRNSGKILSKDELIQLVWPGQIVTDEALTKQIMRLRNILDDQDSEVPLIETHRGVGYRFTAAVTEKVERGDSPAASAAPMIGRRRWLGYASAAVLLIALMFISGYFNGHEKSEPGPSGLQKPINLAILPADSGHSLFNRSGVEYLSNLLSQHEQINAVSPYPDWFDSDAPENLAIELTSIEHIHYSCLINIEQIENMFSVAVKLRTKDEVISNEDLKADSLPELFQKTSDWITVNLSVHANLDLAAKVLNATTDSYALQSYMQGIFEMEVGGNNQAANGYFQSAVNKDPDFIAAWTKLAESFLILGSMDKAISIADTHLATIDMTSQPRIVTDLYFVKALSHFYQGDSESAQETIKLSLHAISSSDDPYSKLSGLKSLALLSETQKDWVNAERYTEQWLELSREFYPFPSHIADIHLRLANLQDKSSQTESMRSNLSEAIRLYENANNSRGVFSSLFSLIKWYLKQNQLDEAVLVTMRAEPYLQGENSPHEEVLFLYAGATAFNMQGLFDRSSEYIERIQQIAEQSKNRRYQLIAEVLKLHRAYVQDDFRQAGIYIKSIYATYADDSFSASNLPFVRAVDMLIAARSADPDQARRNMNHLLEIDPQIEKQFPDFLPRAEGHLLVRTGQIKEGLERLYRAERLNREKQDIGLAHYIGYEILSILLEHPELSYQETLARMEPDPGKGYHFLKVKSQLLAREGKYLDATLLLQEAKLKANGFWKPEDQLLLEEYQVQAK